jgi:soluble lytic murein transglycosylase-like protein
MDLLHALFVTYSLQFNLPPHLLESVCFVESRHEINAVHQNDGNGTPSLGVCQIKLATAQMLGFKGTEKQLMDPRLNVYYAAAYLDHQLRRYKGHTHRALVAYNRGSAKQLTRSSYSDTVFQEWRERRGRFQK